MKKTIILFLILNLFLGTLAASQWIRVNQKGYLLQDIKVAVWSTNEKNTVLEFKLIDLRTKKTVFCGKITNQKYAYGAMQNAARIYFTEYNKAGLYYIEAGNVKSPIFRISNDVYSSSVEVPLKYMRQQRCGYNPFLKDSCHRDDGRIIYHPTKDGQK